MNAKFNADKAARAYAKMIQKTYQLRSGRFIVDDTLEHHTKLCRFIHGVCKHWDHVFITNLSATCLVFLYYSQEGFIKFPIGWKIYFKGSEKRKKQAKSRI